MNDRTEIVAVGGILPPDLGPPPVADWTRAPRPIPLTGADLCVLSETDPASMSELQRDALAVYRLAVRAEGLPKPTPGDLAVRVIEPEPDLFKRHTGGPRRVRLLGREWPSMTEAAAELGVCRATVRRMVERAAEVAAAVPAAVPVETARERGRKAAEEFAASLEAA